MKEFFDIVILDNTIRAYTVSLCIIAIFFLFKTAITKTVIWVLKKLVKREVVERLDTEFVSYIAKPLRLFLLIFIILVATHRLELPTLLEFKIYKIPFPTILEAIVRGIWIWTFVWFCNRLMFAIAGALHKKAQLTEDKSDDQIIIFFRDLLNVIIWIIGVLLIIKFSLGFPLNNILTSISLVGAALALAFKESLENIIASFIIFFDKPFVIGDSVKVGTTAGVVEKIGIRSTRILTGDKTYISVPNKQMADSVLDNQSRRTARRSVQTIELSLSVPGTQLTYFIDSIKQFLSNKLIVNSYSVFLADTGKNAHIIHVEYLTNMTQTLTEFNNFKQETNLFIINYLDTQKIEYAASSSSVVISQANQ